MKIRIVLQWGVMTNPFKALGAKIQKLEVETVAELNSIKAKLLPDLKTEIANIKTELTSAHAALDSRVKSVESFVSSATSKAEADAKAAAAKVEAKAAPVVAAMQAEISTAFHKLPVLAQQFVGASDADLEAVKAYIEKQLGTTTVAAVANPTPAPAQPATPAAPAAPAQATPAPSVQVGGPVTS